QTDRQTGYPSVDKPWLRYYAQKRETFRHETMYESLVNSNANNMESYALSYFGNKITFSKMIQMIDNIATGFYERGIRADERVIVLGLNTPEILCSIYALNKIGAIACMEYITLSQDKIEEIAKVYQSKYAVVIDNVYDKYIDALQKGGVEKVFLARTYSMMPMPMRFLAKKKFKLKNNVDSQNEISGFVNKQTLNGGEPIDNAGQKIAVVISTSGTTGTPKRAELTNDAVNALAYQGHYVDVGMDVGETMLTPAPPFLAFGISLTAHMPLCNGVCLILSVSPEPNFVVKQFIKYKPNLFAGGHIFCDKIMESSKIKKMDLSFLKMIELGGEKIEAEYKEKVDQFFRQHNYNGNIFAGYGMTETAACSTTEMKGVMRRDSVGIPLCLVNMKIINTETGNELRYGEEGEILINSPCAMLGYYNNSVASDEIFEFVDDEKWIHTGDIGKIDEDGFIYVVGRIKRIEITIDPVDNAQVKLYPDYIEHVLSNCEYINQCAVIAIDDKDRKHVPVAFIKILKNSFGTEEQIKTYINENLEEYNRPVKYIFVDDIPLRPNGKTDYKELEKML
ncbi:MAG: class I adenylate-forming enzyme family protein, partial [Eubacteriales bacterium]|nr:class I adenylate-forming enzyme family protein [Eubacteriales bacterium]